MVPFLSLCVCLSVCRCVGVYIVLFTQSVTISVAVLTHNAAAWSGDACVFFIFFYFLTIGC